MKRGREICVSLLSGLYSNAPAGHGQEPGEIRAPTSALEFQINQMSEAAF